MLSFALHAKGKRSGDVKENLGSLNFTLHFSFRSAQQVFSEEFLIGERELSFDKRFFQTHFSEK